MPSSSTAYQSRLGDQTTIKKALQNNAGIDVAHYLVNPFIGYRFYKTGMFSYF